MPFKKVGGNDYTGPSGRHFNLNQVRLYYANGGKFPGMAQGGPMFAKGHKPVAAAYAAGGPVLGREREFMKEPDPFRSSDDGLPPASQGRNAGEPPTTYGKGGAGQAAGNPNPKPRGKKIK